MAIIPQYGDRVTVDDLGPISGENTSITSGEVIPLLQAPPVSNRGQTYEKVNELVIENEGPGEVYITLNEKVFTLGMPIKANRARVYISEGITGFFPNCKSGVTTTILFDAVNVQKVQGVR